MALEYFVNCVKERMCVNGVHVFGGKVAMKFVSSQYVSAEFCLILGDYSAGLNVTRAVRTAEHVLYLKKSASHEFEAQKTLMNSFAAIRGKSDRKKELLVRKLLPVYHLLMKEKREDIELALLRYKWYLAFFSKVDDALRRMCLQWRLQTLRRAETTHVREKKTDILSR